MNKKLKPTSPTPEQTIEAAKQAIAEKKLQREKACGQAFEQLLKEHNCTADMAVTFATVGTPQWRIIFKAND